MRIMSKSEDLVALYAAAGMLTVRRNAADPAVQSIPKQGVSHRFFASCHLAAPAAVFAQTSGLRSRLSILSPRSTATWLGMGQERGES